MALALLTSLAAVLALSAIAAAGGWSVVTLDRLPQGLAPGAETSIGFTVRQHGNLPVSNTNARVQLTNRDSGEKVTVYAQPDGLPGHYRAFFVLNAAGQWDWSINAFEGSHTMPTLRVTPATQTSVAGTLFGRSLTPTFDAGLRASLAMVSVLAGAGAVLLAASGRQRTQPETTAA